MKKLLSKKNFYVLISIFVFILFAYMTYQTPTAGDDWGYALGGAHPFQKALEFYQTWSGRFFSELWGFSVAKNKALWNILNPLIFTLIYIGIYQLIKVERKYISIPILILVMMLTVTAQLRMETYTWIMGTTYVIPLCLSIWYFVVVRKMVSTRLISGGLLAAVLLSNISLFIIGMMMENIAAMMVGAILILLVYSFFERRYLMKWFAMHLLFAGASFLLMRLSPGSAYRLMRDSAEFAALNIFEKIALNYPVFLRQTFLNNYYTVGFYAVILAGFIFFARRKDLLWFKILSIAMQGVAFLILFSFPFGSFFFNSETSLFSMLYWPLYVIDSFAVFLLFGDGHVIKERTSFYLVIAGGCALVMLMSPIYGARSSLYTVFYLIVISGILYDSYKPQRWITLFFLIFCFLMCIYRSVSLVKKYHEVGEKQKQRLEIIEYYRNNPQEKEVWIPRMPIASVHGGDIEPEDTYHLECFKNYYQLPQEPENIHFYYEVNE